MDRKTKLRNFKDKMTTTYGKAAEDVINKNVFKLLQSSRFDDQELEKIESDIRQALKDKPLFGKKKPNGRQRSNDLRNVKHDVIKNAQYENSKKKLSKNGEQIMKSKMLTRTSKYSLKLPKVGSEKRVSQ